MMKRGSLKINPNIKWVLIFYLSTLVNCFSPSQQLHQSLPPQSLDIRSDSKPCHNHHKNEICEGAVEGITRKKFISNSIAVFGAISSTTIAQKVLASDEIPTTGFITRSGLKCYDIKVGSGKSPQWGQVISYHYKLSIRTTENAELTKIDSTYDRKQAFLEKHGNGRSIRGLEEGIHTMKVGGKRRIIIPPSLGYLESGVGPIPPGPNSRRTLNKKLDELQSDGQIIFDVELLLAYDDEADLGYYADEAYTFEQVQEASQRAKAGLAPTFKVY